MPLSIGFPRHSYPCDTDATPRAAAAARGVAGDGSMMPWSLRTVLKMDHPRPFDEPEQIVEEGTPLPRMTRTGDEKVMNDTIGIDISKDHLDTHRLSDGKAKRFTNDRTGLKTLKNWIGPQCCRVVYEPTGRYHRDLEARLSKTAHAMVKVNPKRARRFAEAVGQSAKTDRIDAELLARMGAMLDLKASPLRDEPMNDLREVHVARSALIKDQTACRNRLCGARKHTRQGATENQDAPDCKATCPTRCRVEEAYPRGCKACQTVRDPAVDPLPSQYSSKCRRSEP